MPSRASDTPDDADERPDPPRGRHVVDRALDYRALERRGLTGAQIARRRRKSPGYVSVLLRLGRVLEPLDAAEQAALRSPHITVALAQRVVRRGVPDAEVRAQLRAAAGGASRHNRDGRRAPRAREAVLQTAPQPPRQPTGAPPAAAPGAAAPAGLAGWAWDEGLWRADPERYVADLCVRVAGLHAHVLARARRAAAEQAGAAAARRLDGGQSLRQLARRVGAAQPDSRPASADVTAAERRALEALAVWGAGLAAAAAGATRSLQLGGPGDPGAS